jgi:hypothetical protein
MQYSKGGILRHTAVKKMVGSKSRFSGETSVLPGADRKEA